jgi:hypothetical protein
MPSLVAMQPHRCGVAVSADQVPRAGAAAWVALGRHRCDRPRRRAQGPSGHRAGPVRRAAEAAHDRPTDQPAFRTATPRPIAGNAASDRACLLQQIGCGSAFQRYAAVAMVRLAQGRRGPDLFADDQDGRKQAVSVRGAHLRSPGYRCLPACRPGRRPRLAIAQNWRPPNRAAEEPNVTRVDRYNTGGHPTAGKPTPPRSPATRCQAEARSPRLPQRQVE